MLIRTGCLGFRRGGRTKDNVAVNSVSSTFLTRITDYGHRRTGHPGFWFFGGNLALCRYFSRMLALQIKALEEGIMKYEDP